MERVLDLEVDGRRSGEDWGIIPDKGGWPWPVASWTMPGEVVVAAVGMDLVCIGVGVFCPGGVSDFIPGGVALVAVVGMDEGFCTGAGCLLEVVVVFCTGVGEGFCTVTGCFLVVVVDVFCTGGGVLLAVVVVTGDFFTGAGCF